MFVRVKHLPGTCEFTLVDADLNSETPQVVTMLDLGTVEEAQLDSWQAWYCIAENLVCAELDIEIKRNAARDLSQWLPPISRELLIESRRNDLQGLAELGSVVARNQLDEPVVLNENDPLTVIADWLNH
ncbi:MAG TPA: hypothetical protein DDW55_04385 [Gammaproteobacteria bacterium]|nr:hypothetical protein [Gammaproteobacteria bacterium]